jgi:hypothetical protein
MVPVVNCLLGSCRNEDGASRSLDQEGGNVGHDKEEDDALRPDQQVPVRLEVPGEATEQDVVGCYKGAWRQHNEEVFCDIDALRVWQCLQMG